MSFFRRFPPPPTTRHVCGSQSRIYEARRPRDKMQYWIHDPIGSQGRIQDFSQGRAPSDKLVLEFYWMVYLQWWISVPEVGARPSAHTLDPRLDPMVKFESRSWIPLHPAIGYWIPSDLWWNWWYRFYDLRNDTDRIPSPSNSFDPSHSLSSNLSSAPSRGHAPCLISPRPIHASNTNAHLSRVVYFCIRPTSSCWHRRCVRGDRWSWCAVHARAGRSGAADRGERGSSSAARGRHAASSRAGWRGAARTCRQCGPSVCWGTSRGLCTGAGSTWWSPPSPPVGEGGNGQNSATVGNV